MTDSKPKLTPLAVQKAGLTRYGGLESLVAISIAHLGHFFSVLVLHQLTLAIFPESSAVAAVTAALHIVSPAGLFLSAPYAESTCALFSFLGCLLFTKSLSRTGESSIAKDILVLISGILFGIATTFRTNAILNGLLLLEEALRVVSTLQNGLQYATFRRIAATGFGGLAVGFGFLLPQYLAYSEFCGNSTAVKRTWCDSSLPSIYGFVQGYYWFAYQCQTRFFFANMNRNNGPFRYWTISNIPLFLLATPMFFIMITSGIWGLNASVLTNTPEFSKQPSTETSGISATHPHSVQILRNLAVSQLALTAFTLITAHVQIITRISSAYPVWVWYLAITRNKKDSITKGFVTFMVVYSVIQGGLFASFLPPA